MEFCFSKYSGCGNDFILIDDRDGTFPLHEISLIKKICHRRIGIGADGIILLQDSSKADFRMRIINSDGSEAEMCGNGIRCLMKFIQEIGLNIATCKIETQYRTHCVALHDTGISVEMGDPTDYDWNIDLPLPTETLRIHQLNTGVPHVVEFVSDIEAINLENRGPLVRNHAIFFPKGTNFNIAQISTYGSISVRTFERGVEGETLACGTGATAVALAAAKVHGLKSPIEISTRSGERLKIYFEMVADHPSQVWMAGPAEKIFSGHINLDDF